MTREIKRHSNKTEYIQIEHKLVTDLIIYFNPSIVTTL